MARVGRSDGVKLSDDARVCSVDDPLREISHIDVLNRIIRLFRHEYLAAPFESCRPIAKPARWVSRTDD